MLIPFLISYLVTYVFLGLPAETSAIASAILALGSAIRSLPYSRYFEGLGAAFYEAVKDYINERKARKAI